MKGNKWVRLLAYVTGLVNHELLLVSSKNSCGTIGSSI
jgi:hypothetical protein